MSSVAPIQSSSHAMQLPVVPLPSLARQFAAAIVVRHPCTTTHNSPRLQSKAPECGLLCYLEFAVNNIFNVFYCKQRSKVQRRLRLAIYEVDLESCVYGCKMQLHLLKLCMYHKALQASKGVCECHGRGLPVAAAVCLSSVAHARLPLYTLLAG